MRIGDTDGATASATMSAPYALEAWIDGPRRALAHVAETRQILSLDDVTTDDRFREEGRAGGRAVLCVPIQQHGRLLALLYLAHGETVGAFRALHVDMMRILAGQMAISLENARGSTKTCRARCKTPARASA